MFTVRNSNSVPRASPFCTIPLYIESVYLDINVPYKRIAFAQLRLNIIHFFPDEARNAVGIIDAEALEGLEIVVHLLILCTQRTLPICLAKKNGTVEFRFAFDAVDAPRNADRFEVNHLF